MRLLGFVPKDCLKLRVLFVVLTRKKLLKVNKNTKITLITKESIMLFDMEFYSQIDDVAMGSPLGPTLANVFLCHHEEKWLNDCPNNFKPVFYKRYVDDIFVLFKKSEYVQLFVNYMNNKHKNISFSYEAEKDGAIPFFSSEKRVSLSLMCIEKKLLLEYTPTFPALYH